MEYVFSNLRMDEYQKLTKALGNLKKIEDFIKKNDKICETIKTIPLLLKTMQCPISKPKRRVSGP